MRKKRKLYPLAADGSPVYSEAKLATYNDKMKQGYWVKISIDMMEQGKSADHITDTIAKFKKVTKKRAQEILSFANAVVRNRVVTASKTVTAIHIERYNRRIKQLLAVEELDYDNIFWPTNANGLIVDENGNLTDELPGENQITYDAWLYSRNRKIKAFDLALDTMLQKERLLKITPDILSIVFNETIEINIREKKKQPDWTKLSFEKQVRMMEIMQQARQQGDEIPSVTAAAIEDQVTEDIVHEVIEEANITKIAQTLLPPPVPEPITSFDPTKRLKEKMRIMALKRLMEAGAHLDAAEQKLLDDYDNENKS